MELLAVHPFYGCYCTFVLLEGDKSIDTLHLYVEDGSELVESVSQMIGGALPCDLGNVDLLVRLAVILFTLRPVFLVTVAAAAL